jgi:hypothetical protein
MQNFTERTEKHRLFTGVGKTQAHVLPVITDSNLQQLQHCSTAARDTENALRRLTT